MGAIGHVGIYVKHIQEMARFYTEVFSLRTAVHQHEGGDYIAALFNEKGAQLEVYKLAFGDGSLLELIECRNLPECAVEKEKLYAAGQAHIAVTVESAETIYEELAKRGCQMLSGPCISPDGKARVFFAKDPEGNYLELVEEL